jgi:hypothetical protein
MPKTWCMLALVMGTLTFAPVQAQKIYWGDEVSAGWNGKWPQELQTAARAGQAHARGR